MSSQFKEKWVTDFTDSLVVKTIWDSFPSASKKWDKFKVYDWLEKKEDDFKSYLGGASWDRTLDNMRPDFKKWHDEIMRAIDDYDDAGTCEYNRFCKAVDSDFAKRYEEILEQYYKDAGLDD